MAAAKNINNKTDFSYPYYREQAFCIGLGMTSRELLLSFLAKDDDPNSSGRQMPQHFGSKKLNIVSQSSPTGTQYLQAVGASFVCQREKNKAIVYVSSGEGTTSQGDFHESLNWASREKAPVIFIYKIINMQFQFQLKSKQVENRFIILLLDTILYQDMM